MDKLTPKEVDEVAALVILEGREGIAPAEARSWVEAVEARARELHRRYADACNRPLRPDEESRIEQLEGFMRCTFERMGLGLYLNGDPRGNPIGILTPKTGRYNTMGGRECGWRL